MIGLFCEPTFFVFCRRAAPWRQQARELLEHFRAAGQRRRNVVSVGLVMMPRGLRVAASRVRWARRGHLPRRQDGWQRAPGLGCRTARGHRDFDAANAYAHESADLEQLETNGAAGCFGKMCVMQPDARKAQSST